MCGYFGQEDNACNNDDGDARGLDSCLYFIIIIISTYIIIIIIILCVIDVGHCAYTLWHAHRSLPKNTATPDGAMTNASRR